LRYNTPNLEAIYYFCWNILYTTLRSFFTDNVNSILGAISIHLMVVIAFLWFKLGEVEKAQKEQVLIEFNAELVPPADKPEEQSPPEKGSGDALPSLDRQTLHSIATNVSSKLDPEISTEKYEQQVLQELGISSLNANGAALERQAEEADENAIADQARQEERDQQQDLDVPNVLRKDNTTVSYFLEGRWHKYVYIPTYKCQGGGTVILDIMISQGGKVISALIADNKSTPDECLREEAYRSATTAQFNADPKAPAKQLGTMTYVFLPQ
jgi:TonB family protein